MNWAVGVTTCPSRRGNLLPQTLASLRLAGWAEPHLFVDGDSDGASWEREFGLPVTCRHPAVRTAGNWHLAMGELLHREPEADRYMIAQDDFCTYHNLRQYLEQSPYPDKGYLNLYTFPSNESLAPRGADGKQLVGWYRARELGPDSPPGFQTGRGAVCLVFSRSAVLTLLSARSLICKPLDGKTESRSGWRMGQRKIDGAIVTAMNQAGWSEYVHWPSLTQHLGAESSMANLPHQRAVSFLGMHYDAVDLLKRVRNT